METPKSLAAGEERKLWKELFINFEPINAAQIEMSKRYVEWLILYRNERQHCEANGTTILDKQGVEKTSPHVTNMQSAENHMRQLWKQLEPLIKQDAGDGAGSKYFGESNG